MFSRPFEVWVIYRTIKVPHLRRSDHLGIDSQPFRAGLILAGRPSGPRGAEGVSSAVLPHSDFFCRSPTQGLLLRFSHTRTNEALASPALNPDFLYAALDATADAVFVKESRKKRAGATELHRKSGEARDQSRDSFTER